jgi:hypothetical protein
MNNCSVPVVIFYHQRLFAAQDLAVLASVADTLPFDADPDPSYHFDADPYTDFYLMQIRIRLFTLMRIQILASK